MSVDRENEAGRGSGLIVLAKKGMVDGTERESEGALDGGTNFRNH